MLSPVPFKHPSPSLPMQLPDAGQAEQAGARLDRALEAAVGAGGCPPPGLELEHVRLPVVDVVLFQGVLRRQVAVAQRVEDHGQALDAVDDAGMATV